MGNREGNLINRANQSVTRSQATETKLQELIQSSRSKNTRKAYKSALEKFGSWCKGHGFQAFPAHPSTIASFLVEHCEALSVSSLQIHLSALGFTHRMAGHEDPTKDREVVLAWQGLRRTRGVAPKKKKAILPCSLAKMIQETPDTLIGNRDRALLLTGFTGALRRSEIVGLQVEDLERNEDGFLVTIRRSKTDQTGEGQTVAIPYVTDSDLCPVRAIQAWIKESEITSGPLFRGVRKGGTLLPGGLTDQTVARIIKKHAKAGGLDPQEVSGHSLRSGFATAAARGGAKLEEIQGQTRHKSLSMVVTYVQQVEKMKNKAVTSAFAMRGE